MLDKGLILDKLSNKDTNVDSPKVDSPKVDSPKVDSPKVDSSKVDSSKVSFDLNERPKTPQELNMEERNDIDNVITSEVNKLEIAPKNDEFKIEELNLDMDDLSMLEEVYTDKIEPVNLESSVLETNLNTNQLKMDINDAHESPTQVNMSDAHESPTPVKTIIIDTKKHSKNTNADDNLEINDYDDDTDDDSSQIKQKVYNRYSKKRDYSFFE